MSQYLTAGQYAAKADDMHEKAVESLEAPTPLMPLVDLRLQFAQYYATMAVYKALAARD